MLPSNYAKEQAESQAAVGVSAECFGGDIGRSLVVADHPRHDAPGIPELQGILGVLRKNRDEHIGRSPAEAGSSWNHHHRARSIGWAKADLLAHNERNRSCAGPHGNGPVGSRARRYRQPSACPANTKRQRKISGCRMATLGGKESPFNGLLTGSASANGTLVVPRPVEDFHRVRQQVSHRLKRFHRAFGASRQVEDERLGSHGSRTPR